jgi:hypothetical protein
MSPSPTLAALDRDLDRRSHTLTGSLPGSRDVRRADEPWPLPCPPGPACDALDDAALDAGTLSGTRALAGYEDSPESTATFLESLTLCVMEVLAGVRDLDQVARWVSEDVYHHLTQRVVLSARARQVKGDRTIRPTFTIGRTVQSEPAPGIVEGVVIVHGKARSRAVALRLERLNSRWRASAINVL